MTSHCTQDFTTAIHHPRTKRDFVKTTTAAALQVQVASFYQSRFGTRAISVNLFAPDRETETAGFSWPQKVLALRPRQKLLPMVCGGHWSRSQPHSHLNEGLLCTSPGPLIYTVLLSQCICQNILCEFPALTKPISIATISLHTLKQHIVTSGPWVYSCCRPIAEDIPETAVTTPFTLYEFRHMLFGLCNAAQTF